MRDLQLLTIRTWNLHPEILNSLYLGFPITINDQFGLVILARAVKFRQEIARHTEAENCGEDDEFCPDAEEVTVGEGDGEPEGFPEAIVGEGRLLLEGE